MTLIDRSGRRTTRRIMTVRVRLIVVASVAITSLLALVIVNAIPVWEQQRNPCNNSATGLITPGSEPGRPPRLQQYPAARRSPSNSPPCRLSPASPRRRPTSKDSRRDHAPDAPCTRAAAGRHRSCPVEADRARLGDPAHAQALGQLMTGALAGRPTRTAPLDWVFARGCEWGIFLPAESDDPAWPPGTTYLKAGTSLTLPPIRLRPDVRTGASAWVSWDGNLLSRPLLLHPILTALAAVQPRPTALESRT